MLMMVMTNDYNDKQNDEHTNYHGDHDDDHHHSDQTEVPMWPGGDSPCFNCGTAVKSCSRELYLRELYLDALFLREHKRYHDHYHSRLQRRHHCCRHHKQMQTEKKEIAY